MFLSFLSLFILVTSYSFSISAACQTWIRSTRIPYPAVVSFRCQTRKVLGANIRNHGHEFCLSASVVLPTLYHPVDGSYRMIEQKHLLRVFDDRICQDVADTYVRRHWISCLTLGFMGCCANCSPTTWTTSAIRAT